MKIHFVLLFLLVVLLSGCKKEAEMEPKNFPVIYAYPAKSGSSKQVSFEAEFLNMGNEPIRDYGFEWGDGMFFSVSI